MAQDITLAYVARGDASLAPVAASMIQVKAWSSAAASVHRLQFALLAGERCLAEHARAPPSLLPPRVRAINATDANLHQLLQGSAVARAWLRHTKALGGKVHTYTVPKLFLFELMPEADLVITLDNDVVALADIAYLADEVQRQARAEPHAALFYASEQQNKYRWILNWSLAASAAAASSSFSSSSSSSSSPWPAQRNGVNGGVGVQLLSRLRNRADAYRQLLHLVLRELPGAVVGGAQERGTVLGLGDQSAFSAAAVLAPPVWATFFRPLPCEWNWQTCVWSYGRVHECPLHEGKLNMTALSEAGYRDLNCTLHPVLHDGSCHRPPKLLHFDCPGDLKALASSSFAPAGGGGSGGGSRGDDNVVGGGGGAGGGGGSGGSLGSLQLSAFLRAVGGGPNASGAEAIDAQTAVAELHAALRSPRAEPMCRRADLRSVGQLGRRGIASATFCNATFLLTRLLAARGGSHRRGRGGDNSGDASAVGGGATSGGGANQGDGARSRRRLAESAQGRSESGGPEAATVAAMRHAAWCGGGLQERARTLLPPLPAVYVYGESIAPLAADPFGFAIDDLGTGSLSAANGPTYVNAIHARLAAASVADPSRADLFFIPESAANDSARCGSLAGRLDAYWAGAHSAAAAKGGQRDGDGGGDGGGGGGGGGGGVNYFRRRRGRDHFTASHFRASLLGCSAWQAPPFRHVRKLVGVLQSPWFREGRPLPMSDARMATRPFACARWMAVCPWLPNATREETEAAAAAQHIVEVPYGGSVHDAASWRSSAPAGERPILAVAAFNSRGHRNLHGQMALRRALLAQCQASARATTLRMPPLKRLDTPAAIARAMRRATAEALGATAEALAAAAAAPGDAAAHANHTVSRGWSRRRANRAPSAEPADAVAVAVAAGGGAGSSSRFASTCHVITLQGRYSLAGTDDPQGNGMLLAALDSYRQSVFSLQPAGDDPARKGLIDSATSGCIPVLFQPQQRQLWPHHWGAWVADATVLLPMEAVLNGSLDVVETLRAIPARRVARMQQVLRRNAHRLHYARVGSRDATGDALEIALAHLAQDRREEGQGKGEGRRRDSGDAPSAMGAPLARCDAPRQRPSRAVPL